MTQTTARLATEKQAPHLIREINVSKAGRQRELTCIVQN